MWRVRTATIRGRPACGVVGAQWSASTATAASASPACSAAAAAAVASSPAAARWCLLRRWASSSTARLSSSSHLRGVFPTLRSPSGPDSSSSSSSGATASHLLLHRRLGQLEEAGRALVDRGKRSTPSQEMREHATQALAVIERMLEEQRVGTSGTAATAGQPATPAVRPFILTSQHYQLILALLRQLPSSLVPLRIVDAVWSHMTVGSLGGQVFRPPVRSINQVLDLYSSLGESDRAWAVWQYVVDPANSSIAPSIITMNTVHTAMMRAITARDSQSSCSATASPLERERFEDIWRFWEETGPGSSPSGGASSPPEVVTDVPELFAPLLPFHRNRPEQLAAAMRPPHPSNSSQGDLHFHRNILLYFNLTAQPLRAAAWAYQMHAQGMDIGGGRGHLGPGHDLAAFKSCMGALERHLPKATTNKTRTRLELATLCQVVWTFFTRTVGARPDAFLATQWMRILASLRQSSALLRATEEALEYGVYPHVTAQHALLALMHLRDDERESALETPKLRQTPQQLRLEVEKAIAELPKDHLLSPTLLRAPVSCKMTWYLKHRVLLPLTLKPSRTNPDPLGKGDIILNLIKAYVRTYEHSAAAAKSAPTPTATTSTRAPNQEVWLLFKHLRSLQMSKSSTNLSSIFSLELFETVLDSLHHSLPAIGATRMQKEKILDRARQVVEVAAFFYTPRVSSQAKRMARAPVQPWMHLRESSTMVRDSVEPHVRQLGFISILGAFLEHVGRYATGSQLADQLVTAWFLPQKALAMGVQGQLLPNHFTLQALVVCYLRGGRSNEVPQLLLTFKKHFNITLTSAGYETTIGTLNTDAIQAPPEERLPFVMAAMSLYREMTQLAMAPTSGIYSSLLNLLSLLGPEERVVFFVPGAHGLEQTEPMEPWRAAQGIFREMRKFVNLLNTSAKAAPVETGEEEVLIKGDIHRFRMTNEHYVPMLRCYTKASEQAASMPDSVVGVPRGFLHKSLQLVSFMVSQQRGRYIVPDDTPGARARLVEIHRLVLRCMQLATREPNPIVPLTSIPALKDIDFTTPFVPSVLALYTWTASQLHVGDIGGTMFAKEWTTLMGAIEGHLVTLRNEMITSNQAKEELTMSANLVEQFCAQFAADDSAQLSSEHYAALIQFHAFSSPSASFERVWSIFSGSQLRGVLACPRLIKALFTAMGHFGQHAKRLQLYRNMHLMPDVLAKIPPSVHHDMIPWMADWARALEVDQSQLQTPEQRAADIEAIMSEGDLVSTPSKVLIRSPDVAARKLFLMRLKGALPPAEAEVPVNRKDGEDVFGLLEEPSNQELPPSPPVKALSAFGDRRLVTMHDYWQLYQNLQLYESRSNIVAAAAGVAPSGPAPHLVWAVSSLGLLEQWEPELTSRGFWPHGRTQPYFVDLLPLSPTVERIALGEGTSASGTGTEEQSVARMRFDHVASVVDCVLRVLALRRARFPEKAVKDLHIRVAEENIDSSANVPPSGSIAASCLRHLSLAPEALVWLDLEAAQAIFPPQNSKATSAAKAGLYVRVEKQQLLDLLQAKHLISLSK